MMVLPCAGEPTIARRAFRPARAPAVAAVGLALGIEDALPVALLELGLRRDVHLDADRAAVLLDLEDRDAGRLNALREGENGKLGAPLAHDLARFKSNDVPVNGSLIRPPFTWPAAIGVPTTGALLPTA